VRLWSFLNVSIYYSTDRTSAQGKSIEAKIDGTVVSSAPKSTDTVDMYSTYLAYIRFSSRNSPEGPPIITKRRCFNVAIWGVFVDKGNQVIANSKLADILRAARYTV